MSDRGLELISAVATAITSCSLYSKEHEVVLAQCAKAVGLIEGMYDEGQLGLTVLGEALLVNGRKVKSKGLHAVNFIGRMRRKGIQQLVFHQGVTAPELVECIAGLAAKGSPKANLPHIAVGSLEIRFNAAGGSDPAAVISAGAERIKALHSSVSHFGSIDIVGIEEIVIGFLSVLRRQENVLRIVQPIRAHSDYTYAHSANVTVLSMFIAETIGVDDEVLQDVGVAGLMHDIGKVFVDKKILEKDSKLDAGEWDEMKKHTVFGAQYLASLPEVPRLAFVGAFEHHMKFDGTGYPNTRLHGRRQHPVSQIIAIADFFDALRTERPYRRPLEMPAILGMLKDSSGKDFNPVLVDHFIRSLSAIPGGF